MFNYTQIKNYIEDNEFHLDIFAKKIHIINYDKIVSLGEEKIILLVEGKKLYLFGKHFSLKRMEEEELLIEGRILRLELES